VIKDPESAKLTLDWLSAGVVVATIVQLLPAVAALASLVYTVIRIYESNTGKLCLAWIGRNIACIKSLPRRIWRWFARRG
jgi:hypothetical protein